MEVRRVAPKLMQVPAGKDVDLDTLRAVLVNRMHLLRNYARQVTAPIGRDELRHATGRRIRAAKKLLIRDALLLDGLAVKMAGAPLPQGIAFLPLCAGGALMAVFALPQLWRPTLEAN